jgi:hypothetical protein
MLMLFEIQDEKPLRNITCNGYWVIKEYLSRVTVKKKIDKKK